MDVVGVVPIFMSAGAAVLPTLLAAATSVAALLLKPRELTRLIRANPGRAAASGGAAVLVIAAATWWIAAPASASALRRVQAAHYDWAAVARQIINEERAGRQPTSPNADEGAGLSSAIGLGHDFSRCSFAGGTSPEHLLATWNFVAPDAMFWSAAVTGNFVFAAGCQQDVPPFGKLVCLERSTGRAVWEVSQVKDDYLRPIFSSPAVTADGRFVIVGEGLHEDRDCQLRCFDAHTGEFRWAVKTPLHIESSPAIFGDMVVVGCGAIEGADGKATGDPGHVLAVRISDGRELWRFAVNDPESSPAIDEEGNVYIGSGFNGNAVVALRSQSDDELRAKGQDRVLWKTAAQQPVTSAVTLWQDLVIVGAGNSDFAYANPNPQGWVLALDRKTGRIRWSASFADAVLGEVSAHDGKVICPIRTGEVAALDAGDGHQLWKTPISGKSPVLAGCAFSGTRVYAVSSDGYLAVLDAADGKVLGRSYINDPTKPQTGKCFASPQVGDGRVIVGGETGGIRCYVGTGSGQ